MSKQTKTPRNPDAIGELRKAIQRAQKNPYNNKPHLYTVLRHVSKSGMTRPISVLIQTKEGISRLDYWVANALGYRIARDNNGLKVQGCGMGMGYDLVQSIGMTIYPKGTKKPHSTRNGKPDTHGGYALSHSWL
jgi:hypothetical protein